MQRALRTPGAANIRGAGSGKQKVELLFSAKKIALDPADLVV